MYNKSIYVHTFLYTRPVQPSLIFIAVSIIYKINGWKLTTDTADDSIIPPAYQYASVFVKCVCPGAKYDTNPPKHIGCNILFKHTLLIFAFKMF